MGTLGIVAPNYERYGALTTPDPASLHADLADLAERGVSHLALEASSHGLDQHRLDGIELAAGAFTNLSRDHLDYHPTEEAYLKAKLRLFTELLPVGAPVVLNADADCFEAVAEACAARGQEIVPFGQAANDTGIRLDLVEPGPDHLNVRITVRGREFEIGIPLAGSFQAMNALCALGLVLVTGGPVEGAVAACGALVGAPGRLQRVARRDHGAPIYVDYAHTPDALATVLAALRPHADKRLIVVFGAGGDRDPGKRPMMGEVAARLADIAYVTDDNPRSEDPATIRAAILTSCPGGIEIGDRAEAIETAIATLKPGDLLVIAGKGHERGQIVGDTIHPFVDGEIAQAAVARLEHAA